MKIILKCKNEACAYTTTSAQLLQKHQSATHPELRKKRGPKPKEIKKSKAETNRAHYAKLKEQTHRRKAIIKRLANSFSRRKLRETFSVWQDNTKLVFADEKLLMKLDGLPPPSRMPPCYVSKPSPQRWGPRPPRPVSLSTGTTHYKIALGGELRKRWPQTPLSFARMRHCKLAKVAFHGGDDSPATAYMAE